ncbi:Uncharacterized protein Adt_39768 [Abeliophyllum distichum]|uniref:Reverse transcriptase zinc-binding domain-containing protein n=1 Tax=Abeliophyllum distichum TaxID=126358 RepID=A0ABD1Q605_9LAMI
MSRAFDCKLWWKFRKQESLWSWVMKAKYCRLIHANLRTTRSQDSPLWKRLLQVRHLVEPHLAWKIGEGKIDIWCDQWIKSGALNSLIPQQLHSKTYVLEFRVDDILQKKLGIQLASKCQCCNKEETINHVFLNGKCAKEVWNHYSLNMGIPLTNCPHPITIFMMWISNRLAKPRSLIAAVPLLNF